MATEEEQAQEVYRVKRSEHGVIVDPVTLPPETSAARVSETPKSWAEFRP